LSGTVLTDEEGRLVPVKKFLGFELSHVGHRIMSDPPPRGEPPPHRSGIAAPSTCFTADPTGGLYDTKFSRAVHAAPKSGGAFSLTVMLSRKPNPTGQ
jgi:hypothetical protein